MSVEQNEAINDKPLQPTVEFGWIDTFSSLLDNKFKVPFTEMRFGIDALIGLIPGVGDWVGLGISAVLVMAIMRRGVGVGMIFRMMWNILVDGMIGTIPLVGDIFDFRHKANRRNVEMLRQYYTDNPNPPDAKRSFLWVGLMMLAFVVLTFYLFLKLIKYAWVAFT
jgi:Domain of unknown function (DUF4112)